jgi:hypothetical protein
MFRGKLNANLIKKKTGGREIETVFSSAFCNLGENLQYA